jgi:hypothetical protein
MNVVPKNATTEVEAIIERGWMRCWTPSAGIAGRLPACMKVREAVAAEQEQRRRGTKQVATEVKTLPKITKQE